MSYNAKSVLLHLVPSSYSLPILTGATLRNFLTYPFLCSLCQFNVHVNYIHFYVHMYIYTHIYIHTWNLFYTLHPCLAFYSHKYLGGLPPLHKRVTSFFFKLSSIPLYGCTLIYWTNFKWTLGHQVNLHNLIFYISCILYNLCMYNFDSYWSVYQLVNYYEYACFSTASSKKYLFSIGLLVLVFFLMFSRNFWHIREISLFFCDKNCVFFPIMFFIF